MQDIINLIDNLKMFEDHYKKIENPSDDILFGILSYDYNGDYGKKYTPSECNIGDYIQSLAARQYINNVSFYIDRDKISYEDRKMRLIMNAWYYIYNGNCNIHKNINPLLISVHINNTDEIKDENLEFYKNNEPIGCRDIATRDFLISKGIRSYFSGCLTLTLGRTYFVPKENRKGGIYFVDADFKKLNEESKSKLIKILEKYHNEKRYHVSHSCPIGYEPKDMLEAAESLIREYAEASLIITGRIHCALPCLGLGVPVILISDYDCRRYEGLYDFFNYVGKSKDGNFVFNVNTDKDGYVVNGTKHLQYKTNLEKICIKFCNSAGKLNIGEKKQNTIVQIEQYTDFKDTDIIYLKNDTDMFNELRKRVLTFGMLKESGDEDSSLAYNVRSSLAFFIHRIAKMPCSVAGAHMDLLVECARTALPVARELYRSGELPEEGHTLIVSLAEGLGLSKEMKLRERLDERLGQLRESRAHYIDVRDQLRARRAELAAYRAELSACYDELSARSAALAASRAELAAVRAEIAELRKNG